MGTFLVGLIVGIAATLIVGSLRRRVSKIKAETVKL